MRPSTARHIQTGQPVNDEPSCPSFQLLRLAHFILLLSALLLSLLVLLLADLLLLLFVPALLLLILTRLASRLGGFRALIVRSGLRIGVAGLLGRFGFLSKKRRL